jgi:hypothetical protein
MSSAMVGNVLSMMYAQEIFYYTELIRRALLPNTEDPTAKRFQEKCIASGIPKNLLVPENWRIVPERVLGAGDNMLGQAQADALMSQKPSFEPEAQRKIQRLWTSQTLNDPDRALELVPEEQRRFDFRHTNAEDVCHALQSQSRRKGVDRAVTPHRSWK